MSHRENIARIKAVHLALEELASDVVFVGGATVSLYSTRRLTLEEGLSIRIFSAPYFLATKLEAFVDRGENDGRLSSDFEDIVHVLNNRSSVWGEIGNTDEPVKQFLKSEFAKLLDQKYIDEWISVHLEYNEQRRVGFILGSISEIVES